MRVRCKPAVIGMRPLDVCARRELLLGGSGPSLWKYSVWGAGVLLK